MVNAKNWSSTIPAFLPCLSLQPPELLLERVARQRETVALPDNLRIHKHAILERCKSRFAAAAYCPYVPRRAFA